MREKSRTHEWSACTNNDRGRVTALLRVQRGPTRLRWRGTVAPIGKRAAARRGASQLCDRFPPAEEAVERDARNDQHRQEWEHDHEAHLQEQLARVVDAVDRRAICRRYAPHEPPRTTRNALLAMMCTAPCVLRESA